MEWWGGARALEERSLRAQNNTYWGRVYSMAHLQIDIGPSRYTQPRLVWFERPVVDPDTGCVTIPVETSWNPDAPTTTTHHCFLWLEHDQPGALWNYRYGRRARSIGH